MMRTFYLAVLGLGLMPNLSAQGLLSNQGAQISIGAGALVSVQGSVQNDLNGSFDNRGEIYLTQDWRNDANNAAFSSLQTGIVVFHGDDQRIAGRSTTRFYDLRLEGSGIKYGDLRTEVGGILRLNDREFALDTHAVQVFNGDPLAVRTGLNGQYGFVSAQGRGGLEWEMDRQTDYFFPLGSSQGQPRFRPVRLSPASAPTTAERLRLRHANVDASNEGFDRSRRALTLCEVQPLYYHRLMPQGNLSVDYYATFFYDAATEGVYEQVGQWGAQAYWEEESEGTAGQNANLGLQTLRTNLAISDFNTEAFALVRVAGPLELRTAANPICANDGLQLEAVGGFGSYDFFMDSLLVQAGSSEFYARNGLAAGNYRIWVQGFDAACGRVSDTLTLQVLPSPIVAVANDTIIVRGTAAQLWASGGDFYRWSPADSALSCAICPQTAASPSATLRYVVEVENLDGCLAWDTVLVDVRDYASNVLFIPNVITPNGDGYNDEWRIDNISLFPKNKVKIVNRLGDIVYQSEYYQNNWDGRYSGGKLPAGTYYYLLDLGEGWGVFKGSLTIIRE